MRRGSTTIQIISALQILGGAILVTALSLWVFNQWMSPPPSDMRLMVQFLIITAFASILAGYLAYRVGWINRSPTLRWTLMGGYALASLLTFINVWVVARLMFASEHDLQLATVLLLFAGGIAMVLGLFLSQAVTDRLRLLDQAVGKIAHGELGARVQVEGQDEVARLAASFNQMAFQLQEADRKQRENETLRRDLVAWVSHDLQTPLASIRAIIEALADGVVEDRQTVHRYLATIQREIGALSHLMDDLFQMAQLDAGGLPLKRERNSLSDLISDTLESFSALAEQKGIELRGSVEDGIDPVNIDPQRIGQVLNNLVSNALRFSPAGGVVALSARRKLAHVEVTVTDTGEGIPAEDLPHIFERFYRGDKSRSRATGGAGLGLAIARGIVSAHDGELEVSSQPGETCFRFTLPG